MRTFRSYRLVPALLALSLVLTAATPLVRHSCGMTEAEMATKPCCKGDAGHHDAPATAMHDGAMPHGTTLDAAPPCHAAPGQEAPARHDAPAQHDAPCPDVSDRTTVRAACCASVEVPAAPALERVQLLPADLPALVAAFVLPPEPPPSPPRWSGDPSPPAPVALHVLYESFLI